MSERLTIDADLAQLARVRSWIVEHLQRAGIGPAVSIDVELVITEALANVVRHTFAGTTGAIEITIDIDAEQVRVVITDDGPPWDGTVTTPRADGSGGYGVQLIEEVMDRVEHRPLDPSGNRLTLEKRISDG
ncbi:MAG TPA: ATP-binding protein [Acidimicrobiales bacterium]|nr:ATP-binding protein [Acidimicrobiales bacterium]